MPLIPSPVLFPSLLTKTKKVTISFVVVLLDCDPLWTGIVCDFYGEKSKFIVPNLILNEELGLLWHLELKVEDIIRAFSTDSLTTLTFLVRRAKSKPLILEHLKKTIANKSPLELVCKSFDVRSFSVVSSLLTFSQVLNAIIATLPVDVQKQLVSMSPVRVSGDQKSSEGIHQSFMPLFRVCLTH